MTEKPFTCPNCKRGFTSTAGFRRHLERHVKDGKLEVIPLAERQTWLRKHGYVVEGDEK